MGAPSGREVSRHGPPSSRFSVKRLTGLVLTVVVASIAVFASLALTPGDPAAALVGGTTPSQEAVAAIREQFRLDDPFWMRYTHWVGDLLSGDPGRSFVYRADIGTLIGPRIETTLMLVAYSALLIILLGIGSGILASLAPRSVDRFVTVSNSVLIGVPTFVVAIVLILLFSRVLPWFPVYGAGDGLTDKLWHLTLPAIAMAVAFTPYVSRITRASMRSQMFSEHVETARSRGIPSRRTGRSRAYPAHAAQRRSDI